MTGAGGIPSLLSLEGKGALVTGGSGGIGSAIVELLGEAGAKVLSVDLPGREPPGEATGWGCDIGDASAVAGIGRVVEERLPGLDLLVHAAGIARDAVLWKMSPEQWADVLRTNLDSAFHLLRMAIPRMRAAGGGSIVLITSINAERGKFGQANYAASKAGLIGLSRTAARELGRFGIRVNCIAPGLIRTPMTGSLTPEILKRAEDETALGRTGAPEDVAHATLFLCTAMSAHVTGQVLRVDGGQLTA